MNEFIVLQDNDSIENRPLTRFRSLFSLRTGIFSELERIQLNYPASRIYFQHPDIEYESLIAGVEGVLPFGDKIPDNAEIISTNGLEPNLNTISTKTIKFGSIIGDCVKTAKRYMEGEGESLI